MTLILEIRVNFTGIHPFSCRAGDLSGLSVGLAWASPCLPIYLSPFTPSVVSRYLLMCPVCRLIQWSAVTSHYQSEPLYQVLILAVSVSAELLWTVADWAQRGGSGLGGAGGWGCCRGVIFRKCWRHRSMRGRQRSAGPLLTKCLSYRKQ